MHWKTDKVTGWGRALAATGDIARPETEAEIISAPSAPAAGNRRSYGDAPLNGGGQSLDMTRMDNILSFDRDTGLAHVGAGMTIAAMARVFVPQGWIPAVMPGTGFATVGGAIGMDVHGKNHHGAGSFGQHVTAIHLATGGAVHRITPEDAPLWRATIGGLGQTGVILSAELQLARCKGSVMVVTERRVENWAEHLAMLDASPATYCVGWIDATATGDALGRGILEEAEVGRGLIPKAKAPKAVPFDAPHFALSAPIVKVFNAAYYHRIPAHGRTVVRSMDSFFFPLDAIHDWNRLYGKRGFHQFQCVVPTDRADGLRQMLATISSSGLASPLAVLKRMGAGRAGFLSFPMEGYTLAVDFPNRDGAADLIRQLIGQTQDLGGRIYLAKDSLAAGPQIKSMYPEWPDWLAQVTAADPDHHLETDMTRRLDLRHNRNSQT